MIEPEAAPRAQQGNGGTRKGRKPLVIRRASADEEASHQQVLAAIDKETKGGCSWLAAARQSQ